MKQIQHKAEVLGKEIIAIKNTYNKKDKELNSRHIHEKVVDLFKD